MRLRALTEEDARARPHTAWGRAGDLMLENDRVQFVISMADGANGYGAMPGGVLDAFVLDAGTLGAGGNPFFDSLDELWPVIDGLPLRVDSLDIDESKPGTLEVRLNGAQRDIKDLFGVAGAKAELIPVRGVVSYRLASGSRALEIETLVHNDGSAPAHVEIGDLLIFGNDSAEMLTMPAGFNHESALTQVDAMGSEAEVEPWAAVVFAERPLQLIRGVSVAALLSSGITGVVRYDVQTVELAPGDEVRGVRWLSLGRDLSEALTSYQRQRGVALGRVSGRVTSGGVGVAGARVSLFEDASFERLVAQSRTDAQGLYDAEVPRGQYPVRASGRSNGEEVHVPGLEHAVAEGYGAAPVEIVTVSEASDAVLDFTLAPAGRLTLDVRDERGGPAAAKLSFQREAELPAPLLAAGERQPYRELGIAQVHWTLGGSTPVRLVPGQYKVIASRGPRHEPVIAEHVAVDAGGGTLAVNFGARVGPLGYVALDSHLHGADSGHGEVTREERLITALAEGLDVAVAADHDTIIDYAPVARQLGIDDRIVTIPGLELTYPSGHHNLWPLPADPSLSNGGSIRWWLADPGLDAVYTAYAARGATVLQLNHGAGYFRGWGYDVRTGHGEAKPAFTARFDAMELHNAKGSGGRAELIPLWFSLLNWGRRVAPLAASDSHARIPEPGSGRTYVWLGTTRPSSTSVPDAVVALRTVASTGPLIELELPDGSPALGRDVPLGPGATLELTIRVWAPSWMPIQSVRLISDGEVLQTFTPSGAPPVTGEHGGLWFEQRVSVQSTLDAWYAVEAEGGSDMAPILPGMTPWAMTAPVFIDADGSPGFTPPCHTHACP